MKSLGLCHVLEETNFSLVSSHSDVLEVLCLAQNKTYLHLNSPYKTFPTPLSTHE